MLDGEPNRDTIPGYGYIPNGGICTDAAEGGGRGQAVKGDNAGQRGWLRRSCVGAATAAILVGFGCVAPGSSPRAVSAVGPPVGVADQYGSPKTAGAERGARPTRFDAAGDSDTPGVTVRARRGGDGSFVSAPAVGAGGPAFATTVLRDDPRGAGLYAQSDRLCTRIVPRVFIVPRKGGFGVVPSRSRITVRCPLDSGGAPAGTGQLP